MIANYKKCSRCGEFQKEQDIIIYNSSNTKFSQCVNCFQKNFSIKPKIPSDNIIKNETNYEKMNIYIQDEEKKLDLKEPIKQTNEINYLKKKKRRISKKFVFKKSKKNNNIDSFDTIIYKIMEEISEKNKILINSLNNGKDLAFICNNCHNSKSTKEYKMIKVSSKIEFINFFDSLYNNLEQLEIKQKLIKVSQNKYNQVLENKKYLIKLKSINIEKNIILIKKDIYYCFHCIYNYLLKSNGFNSLYENDEKKSSDMKSNLMLISGENLIIKSSKINNDDLKEKELTEDNNNNDITFDEVNNLFNDKKANIFDLILGNEDDDNDINDFENNSEENKSMNKNKNNDIKKIDNKKDKRNKKGKSKENKITFKKIIPNNNQININNFNNNSNFKINFKENDKQKNLINMNNLNQFDPSKYIKKNQEKIQPLFFNINYNPNNNYLKPNMINNNNITYLNNNNFSNSNEEVIYERLNNQLSFLNTKLSLISNLNNTRKANNNNINNDLPILISTNNFNENIFHFKKAMLSILNYMNNIGEMLDKYSCINENLLVLMDTMINGNIKSDSIQLLKNNSNYFSQLLNYNYSIQKMNTEICDILNNHINH